MDLITQHIAKVFALVLKNVKRWKKWKKKYIACVKLKNHDEIFKASLSNQFFNSEDEAIKEAIKTWSKNKIEKITIKIIYIDDESKKEIYL